MVSVTRKLGKSHPVSKSATEAKYPVFGATRLVAVPSCLARGERPRQPTLLPATGPLRSTSDNQEDQSELGARITIAQLAEGGASPTLWVRSGWRAVIRWPEPGSGGYAVSEFRLWSEIPHLSKMAKQELPCPRRSPFTLPTGADLGSSSSFADPCE
jgi:hypothetical protein